MAGDSATRDALPAGNVPPAGDALPAKSPRGARLPQWRRARLAQRRKALGLTQESLANLLGVDRSTVARWERGETEPAPWIRPRLARAMGTPVGELAWLLARGDPPDNAEPESTAPESTAPESTAPESTAPESTVPESTVPESTTQEGPVRGGEGARVPWLLPAVPAGFTDRSAELAVLDGVLDEADEDRPGVVVIFAIRGTPGAGATALALHWAHRAASRFPDGQLYADLRGFDPARGPATADDVIRRFLGVLGVVPDRIPSAPDARANLYRSLLADRRMLVVLDNAAGELQLRPLLPAGSRSLVLVTSPHPLADLATASGPLARARFIALGALIRDEAVELLTARIGRQQTQADSVHAVLFWSYQQLSEAAARMFRLLGVHPGPDITAPAAASLAATDAASARRLLDELARVRLITEHAPGRYALHDLVRGYAVQQARDTDSEASRRAAVGRLLDHYLHTADSACSLITSPPSRIAGSPPAPGTVPERIEDSVRARAWFEAERAVLLAAVTLADQAGFYVHGWQLPRAMMPFLAARGYHLEWAATQRTGLSAATRLGNVAAQASCARFLAFACNALADYDEAARHFTDSVAACQRLGDRRGEASGHHGLCLVADRQGRYADALDHAGQAFRLYQETGNRTGGIDMINAIGWYRALLGDYERARASCWQALRLAAEAGYLAGQENAWDNLGYAEHRLGNFGAAIACRKLALRLCRQRGNRVDEATLLAHLGDSRFALGEPARAGEAWRLAVAILDHLGHPDAARIRGKLERAGLDGAGFEGIRAGAPA